MSDSSSERRIKNRLKLPLVTRVVGRESADFLWNEMTRLEDVTAFGARFTIKHPTELGRILHLTTPLPRPLRLYDHADDAYRIYGLVRYVSLLPPDSSGESRYLVGVAFVGKFPPSSFLRDPATRYDVIGQNADGSWVLSELNADTKQQRSEESRIQMAIPVRLELIDEDGKVVSTEDTVTENLSRRGAAVFTSNPLPVGRFLRLTNPADNFTVIAAIRSSRQTDGVTHLHLQFIDREWPLDY